MDITVLIKSDCRLNLKLVLRHSDDKKPDELNGKFEK